MSQKGFSATELLIGVVLSGLLGIFAYKVMTNTLFVQGTQKNISKYHGMVASGLNFLRADLQLYDGSWGENEIALIRVTTDPDYNNNHVLTYYIADRSAPPFTIDLAFESVPDDAVPGSVLLRPLPGYPYADSCWPISPAIAPSEFPFPDSGARGLLYAPGIHFIIKPFGQSPFDCHSNGPNHDGMSLKIAEPDDTAPIPNIWPDFSAQPQLEGTRMFPKKSLTGRKIVEKKVSLVPKEGDDPDGPRYVTVYETGQSVQTIDAIRATSLEFTFDVGGVEKEFSAIGDTEWATVTAVNVGVNGVVDYISATGNKGRKNVPMTFKINWRDASSSGGEQTDEKREFLPNLSTLDNVGIGQMELDDGGGTGTLYAYVPIAEWGTDITASSGKIMRIDPANGNPLPGDPITLTIPTTTDAFIPAKVEATDAGLVIGGYTVQDTGGGTFKRQAYLALIPRTGGANTAIDWGATPVFSPMLGNEDGSDYSGHTYYIPDTMNIAVSGNAIYFGSFTGEDGAKPQILKTTIGAGPTISSSWEPIDAGTTGSESHRLAGLAVNSAGDKLHVCYDALSTADKGKIIVGDPTNVTISSGQATMGNLSEKMDVNGSCMGLDVDDNGTLYVAGEVNVAALPEALLDLYPLTGQTTPPLETAATCTGGVTWAAENNVDGFVDPASAIQTHTMRGMRGFGINATSSSCNQVMYAQNAYSGPALLGTMGEFEHCPEVRDPGFTMRIENVLTASLMNTAKVDTIKREKTIVGYAHMLTPDSGYNCATNTYNSLPVVCDRTGGETWDNCVSSKLGGPTLTPPVASGPVCGNGILEAGEQCDDPNYGGATCETETIYKYGALACNSCVIDSSDCHGHNLNTCVLDGAYASCQCGLPAGAQFSCNGGWTVGWGKWLSDGCRSPLCRFDCGSEVDFLLCESC